MQEDTRLILEKLEELSRDVRGMKEDIREVKNDVAELKADVAVLKTEVAELKADVAILKEEMKEVKKRLDGVEEKTASLWMVMDNEMGRMINVLAEEHGILFQRLSGLHVQEKEREKTELRILKLEAEMRMVKSAVGIA